MAAARPIYKRILRGLALFAIAWVALSVLCVGILRYVDPFTTAFMIRDRFLAWKDDDPSYVYRWQWVDRDQISTSMQLAVIASEDQTFPDHWGFDVKQINSALEDRDRGKRVRGASTLTQQVAKNIFLWPGQSWVRKGIEAYFTVLIEALWPKRRILEMYLNVAEFGRGVYGVEAAARAYFKKPASRLTSSEAALMAAVLPNPVRLRVNAPSPYVRSRQHWIETQMSGLGGTSYLKTLK